MMRPSCTRRRVRIALHCLLLAWFLGAASLAAQNQGTRPAAPPGQAGQGREASDLLQVTLATSRREVTINGAYGVFAEIKNISTSAVTLFTSELVLIVVPEVTHSAICHYSVDGFFPTEYPALSQPPTGAAAKIARTKDPRGFAIEIQPSERYTVFWDVNKKNTDGTTQEDPCHSERQWWQPRLGPILGFVPGEYVFTIDGKAYVTTDGVVDPGYHTFTHRTTLKVGIDQTTSLFAAAFGAALGFLVSITRGQGRVALLQQFRERSGWGRVGHVTIFGRDLFSAALMGAAVTIVASRLADTQFPIKVSVNDVWGAMTIGFASYFVGNKIIDRLIANWGGTNNPAPDSGHAPPSPAPATTPPTPGSAPMPANIPNRAITLDE